MNHMVRRAVAVLALASLSSICVFAAGTAASQPQSAEPEVMQITWLGRTHDRGFPEGSFLHQMLEERFNVDLIEPSLMNYKDAEKFYLLAAANDLPDTGVVRLDHNRAYEQGMIRSIPRDMIEEYAPKVSIAFDQYNGWSFNVAPDDAGAYIGFGALRERDFPAHSNWYRLDWLEAVGIEPNGELVNTADRLYYTTEPFTLDQFKDIMVAFAQNDPDGNGEQDTFGVSTLLIDSVLGAHGTIGKFGDDYNHYENGELKMWYATDGFRAYLLYMKDLYDAGAIDPDAITGQHTLTGHQKWAAGMFGAQDAGIVYADPSNASFMGRAPMNVLETIPTSKLMLAPFVVGANGKSQYRGSVSRGSYFTNAYFTFVGAHVQDDKLARILWMIDDINLDPELSVYAYFGEPGRHFDWAGEPFNSAISAIPGKEYDDPYKEGVAGFDAVWGMLDRARLGWKPTYKGFNEYLEANQRDQMAIFGRFDIFNETDISEVLAKFMPEQHVIAQTYMVEAITGKVDVAETWDSYLADLRDNGYDEIIAAYENTTDVRAFMMGEGG